jgi:hypothetical protein
MAERQTGLSTKRAVCCLCPRWFLQTKPTKPNKTQQNRQILEQAEIEGTMMKFDFHERGIPE